MEEKGPLILALETGVAAGSIAVLRGNSMLFSEQGGVARAEAIMAAIRNALARSYSELAEVDTIAVSIGPGSYTGLRIGISTALGLCRSTGSRAVGVPVLHALAHTITAIRKAAAVPMGGSRTAIQHFYANDSSQNRNAYVKGDIDLRAEIEAAPGTQFLLYSDNSNEESLNLMKDRPNNANFYHGNLAELIGRYALLERKASLEPIYL